MGAVASSGSGAAPQTAGRAFPRRRLPGFRSRRACAAARALARKRPHAAGARGTGRAGVRRVRPGPPVVELNAKAAGRFACVAFVLRAALIFRANVETTPACGPALRQHGEHAPRVPPAGRCGRGSAPSPWWFSPSRTPSKTLPVWSGLPLGEVDPPPARHGAVADGGSGWGAGGAGGSGDGARGWQWSIARPSSSPSSRSRDGAAYDGCGGPGRPVGRGGDGAVVTPGGVVLPCVL